MNPNTLDISQFWFGSHEGRLTLHEWSWGLYRDKFKRMAAEGAQLADFVAFFDSGLKTYRGLIHPDHLKEVPDLDYGSFASPAPGLWLGVENGKYIALPEPRTGHETLLPAIDHMLDADVDCIVEFGSGTGINLARLRLRHPGRDLTYIACEPSDAGRATAATMFARDPGMRSQVLFFDYEKPDLSFLAPFKRPVVFTNHSIEQVAVCGAFYTALLESNVAACVHVEPAGWQRFTNVFDVVLAMYRNEGVFGGTLERHRWALDDARLVDNAAMWAAHYTYNIDLLRQVSAASEKGRIALFALGYDIVGYNPFNPSTLVGWTKR